MPIMRSNWNRFHFGARSYAKNAHGKYKCVYLHTYTCTYKRTSTCTESHVHMHARSHKHESVVTSLFVHTDRLFVIISAKVILWVVIHDVFFPSGNHCHLCHYLAVQVAVMWHFCGYNFYVDYRQNWPSGR